MSTVWKNQDGKYLWVKKWGSHKIDHGFTSDINKAHRGYVPIMLGALRTTLRPIEVTVVVTEIT